MRRKRSLVNSLAVSANVLIGIVMETAVTAIVVIGFNVIIQINITAAMFPKVGDLIFISLLFIKKLSITFLNHTTSHTEDYVENVNVFIVTTTY